MRSSRDNKPQSRSEGNQLKKRLNANPRDRRDQIARATIGLIEEQGVQKASLRAIARRAGCTTGVLTHYYDNKDDLLEEALLVALTDLERDWDCASDEASAVNALRSFSLTQIPVDGGLEKKWSAWQLFVRKRGRYGKVARKLVVLQRENRRKLSLLLVRGQEEGVIRPDLAIDELVDLWNATLNGYGRLSPFMARRMSKQRVNTLVTTQLKLLGGKPS
ncbi:MAG: TetR/AcrR family transcriptional regulator [Pseudomonadota bacterium]